MGLTGITLFRVFGISIQAHWSWLILALLIVSSLAVGWFRPLLPDSSTALHWGMGVIGAAFLFISILIHELCHAVVGRAYKMKIHRITLFLFGGVTDLEDEPPNAKAEFLMAFVGPLSSFALGLAFFGIQRLGVTQDWSTAALALLAYIYTINFAVAAFNMIPGFPLDGGRVLRSILWGIKKDLRWATRIAAGIGQGFGYFLIFVGILSFFQADFASGVWLSLLGLLLSSLARQSYIEILIRENLHGQPASLFMDRNPPSVPADSTLSDLVFHREQYDPQQLYPVVENENQLLGCVDIRNVTSYPENEWGQHTVREITQSCPNEIQIVSDTDAEDALKKMSRTGNLQLFVLKSGQLAGVLSYRGLLRYLNIKLSPQTQR